MKEGEIKIFYQGLIDHDLNASIDVALKRRGYNRYVWSYNGNEKLVMMSYKKGRIENDTRSQKI